MKVSVLVLPQAPAPGAILALDQLPFPMEILVKMAAHFRRGDDLVLLQNLAAAPVTVGEVIHAQTCVLDWPHHR